MKRICLMCRRASPDDNLFCQETFCPAEMSPMIFNDGDWLGDIEILRPVAVLRSSALYEAMQAKRRVLLKVAHPGPENKERLKREAVFFRAAAERPAKHVAASVASLCWHYHRPRSLRQDDAAGEFALLLPLRALPG